MSLQQVQANVSITESHTVNNAADDDDDDDDDDRCLCFTTDEAFNGGGCLQLPTTVDAKCCR